MNTQDAGRKGGNATKKKYGVEHFRKIRAIKPKKIIEAAKKVGENKNQ